MYTRDDVKKLAETISGDETLGDIEVSELHTFGMGLEVFDPFSCQIITVARPHRADIGEDEVLITVDQLRTELVNVRNARTSWDRLHGVQSDEDRAAAKEAQEKALADKEARLAAEKQPEKV